MNIIAVFLIMAVTVSVPAFAGTLTGKRLSDDLSLFLNMEKETLINTEDFKLYLVDVPPPKENIYNNHCTWESFLSVEKCDDTVMGNLYPPVCRVDPPTGENYDEIPGEHYDDGDIGTVVFFSGFLCDKPTIDTAVTAEAPILETIEGRPIDALCSSVALNPLPEEIDIQRDQRGPYRLRLYRLPSDSYFKGSREHYPVFAIREIVPPYRHAAYLLDTTFPSQSIAMTFEWMGHKGADGFLFILRESFFDKDNQYHNKNTYLVSATLDKVEARSLSKEELSALLDEFFGE